MSPIVENAGAALWVHGHTHSSFDYMAGETRVVCNPFGYAANCPGEPNREFDGTLTVEVAEKSWLTRPDPVYTEGTMTHFL